ncbi:lipopolysaccharide kinase InaA family protein [Paracoccus aminophilus]|uniref:lipopolysaccharide kinase InaA family protein n=1 Tax=Paracoccus aminophilus TaxID=34003 RepID=UPI000424D877|nr:lipopolysaccharide kinase InaA family protein [Paracoccus aminophilus]
MRRIESGGRHYWVKQREELSLRWRLQKGNPAQAFEREREGLRRLHAMGLPVPEIVDEGPDYFVTRDAGVPLSHVYKSPDYSETERGRALKAAVKALHRLHEAGVAHGRPNLKDMIWDGKRVTLIDLERFGRVRNAHAAQVLDFIIFAFSCFAVANKSLPQIDQALYLYRMLDMRGIFVGASRWLNCLRWLDPVARALSRVKNSREIAAIPRLFAWLRSNRG